MNVEMSEVEALRGDVRDLMTEPDDVLSGEVEKLNGEVLRLRQELSVTLRRYELEKEAKKPASMTLPVSLLVSVDAEAAKRGLTRSELVRDALMVYFGL